MRRCPNNRAGSGVLRQSPATWRGEDGRNHRFHRLHQMGERWEPHPGPLRRAERENGWASRPFGHQTITPLKSLPKACIFRYRPELRLGQTRRQIERCSAMLIMSLVSVVTFSAFFVVAGLFLKVQERDESR
jgi:hypothetical protein